MLNNYILQQSKGFFYHHIGSLLIIQSCCVWVHFFNFKTHIKAHFPDNIIMDFLST